MSESVPEEASGSVCSQCGVTFRCGMEVGDGQCWCASLPPFMPVPENAPGDKTPGATCLCLECLMARLALKTSA